jgi:hypothetical protein
LCGCDNQNHKITTQSYNLSEKQKVTAENLKKEYAKINRQNNLLWEEGKFFEDIYKNQLYTFPEKMPNNMKIGYFGFKNFVAFFLDSNKVLKKIERIIYITDPQFLRNHENRFLYALQQSPYIALDYTGFILKFNEKEIIESGYKYLNGKIKDTIEYFKTDSLIYIQEKTTKKVHKIAFLDKKTNKQNPTNNYELPEYSIDKYLEKYLENFKEDLPTEAYKIVVYIYEPAPNSHISYFFVKIGHIYFAMEQLLKDGSTIRRSLGYWPKDIVHPFNTISQAKIEREEWQKWTTMIEINVEKEKFFELKKNIIQQNKKLPVYKLESFNCVDWLKKLLQSIDIQLPTSRTSWGFGSASTPGSLGFYFRKLYKQKKLPKNWKIRFEHFGYLPENSH